MPGDAAETRRRLLDAATEEFAARGIAGARVDRIAAAAGCNKALIYVYFGSKDELFDAVFDALVVRTVSEVPIDPDDLAGYAGRLFDGYVAHPEVARLATWFRLERAGDRPPLKALTAAHEEKVAAVEAAQRAGRLPTRFGAGELLSLVVAIAAMWVSLTAEFGETAELAVRRKTVTDAVTVLLEAS
jgi:AcrR family transcriptional regulator